MDLKRRGFTLIELLVVIAIMGILTTVSAVMISNLRAQRQVQAAAEQVKNIILEARAYAVAPKDYNITAPVKNVSVIVSKETLNGKRVTQFVRVSQIETSYIGSAVLIDRAFSKSILLTCETAEVVSNPCIIFEANDASKIGQARGHNVEGNPDIYGGNVPPPNILVRNESGSQRYRIKVDALTGNVTVTKEG